MSRGIFFTCQRSGRGREDGLSQDFKKLIGQVPPSPEDRELAILKYLGRNDRITRGEAVKILRISPSQAKRLLAGMTAKGVVELRGTGRATHYVKSAH